MEGYADGERVRVSDHINMVLQTVGKYLDSLKNDTKGAPVLQKDSKSVNNNKLTAEVGQVVPFKEGSVRW